MLHLGEAWSARGKLDGPKKYRLRVTLIGAWTHEQAEPWIVVTGVAPAAVGVS